MYLAHIAVDEFRIFKSYPKRHKISLFIYLQNTSRIGVYRFAAELNAKIYEKILENDYDEWITETKKYVDTDGKTIDEILESLSEVYEEYDDRVGAVRRVMKYSRGQARISEKMENTLLEAESISFLAFKIRELKSWLDSDNQTQPSLGSDE